MWWLCVALISMSGLTAVMAGTDLVINEVLYDPDGADAGHEFVELINPSAVDAQLDGVQLFFINGADPSSPQLLWQGGAGEILGPGAFFVLGGTQVSGRDRTFGQSLQNGDEALQLMRSGRRIDAVAWGQPEPGLGEGSPATGQPGQSIGRVPDGQDSGDNASDFRALDVVTPGQANLRAQDFRLLSWWPEPAFSELPTDRLLHIEFTASGWQPLQEALLTLDQQSRQLRVEAGGTVRVEFTVECASGQTVFVPHIDTGDGARALGRLTLACGAGSLVFTEIQPRPAEGEPEWVELLNRGPGQLRLDGWGMRDSGGRLRYLAADRVLQAGERHVVSADAARLRSIYPAIGAAVSETQGGWPALNDTAAPGAVHADSLYLVHPDGAVVDLVIWSADLIEARGRPLQRGRIVQGQQSLWLPALGSASPGKAAADEDRIWPGYGLACRPDPFDPAQDELELLVTGAFIDAQAAIYDLRGDLVCPVELLGAGEHLAGRWDGRDVRQKPVPSGAYVVVVRARAPDGGVTRLRHIVGLGRR
ncbi:hypothetical protein DRQ53_00400 [bacterium]|nr:MAG: hypothetical protein DRQ53_00400 [bacterium]